MKRIICKISIYLAVYILLSAHFDFISSSEDI